MADEEKSITMTRNGVTKQVSPKLYKYAVSKGWARQQADTRQSKPPLGADGAGAAGGPLGLGHQRGGFSGVMPPNPMQDMTFGGGFKAGINPLHQAPEGLPSSGSALKDAGADMLNAREIHALGQSGNFAGQAGMGLGTAAGLVGPDILKGVSKAVKGSELGEKALSMSSKSKAMKAAKESARMLGGGVEKARMAEELIQPIREAINAKFEPLHKALERHAIPLSNTSQQIINRLKGSQDPKVAKLVDRLLDAAGNVRTALDYREADNIASRLATQLDVHPKVRDLVADINKGLDTLAQSQGLQDTRAELKGLWKEMNDVRNAAAGSIRSKPGIVKKAVSAVSSKAGSFISGSEKEIEPQVKQAAQKLMDRVSGKGGFNSARRTAGRTGMGVAAAGQVPSKMAPILRAIMSLMQNQGAAGAPHGPQ